MPPRESRRLNSPCILEIRLKLHAEEHQPGRKNLERSTNLHSMLFLKFYIKPIDLTVFKFHFLPTVFLLIHLQATFQQLQSPLPF